VPLAEEEQFDLHGPYHSMHTELWLSVDGFRVSKVIEAKIATFTKMHLPDNTNMWWWLVKTPWWMRSRRALHGQWYGKATSILTKFHQNSQVTQKTAEIEWRGGQTSLVFEGSESSRQTSSMHNVLSPSFGWVSGYGN